ncbi:HK97 family phage prohead protease [Priestia aryabhattai]|uniref:HK97 family phage prohead protease n=1 Tax=Priestia aryabhattai TaxID=412384 RepID=UPI001EC978EF|nr:HK97 family phage prohead protease [Priestia aryabhattai]MBY0094939.1 HK97 family phage prohead protease [Priestia aryabhattai]MBY0105573.1 HK97 family phage prohead protease [Priestia aryabhattai]
MTNKEIRTLTMPIELRSMEENSEKRYIVGYALKFNSESEDLGGFVEKIDSRALNGADMSDVRALFNHDANQVLGRSKAGTLKLEVDEIGLKYTIDPPDTQSARDLLHSMSRGDIDQSSFGFSINHDTDDEWEYNEQRGLYVRTIKQFRNIFDVSVVTYPAYSATESVVGQRGLEVAHRSLTNHKNELEIRMAQEQIAIELELLTLL